MPSKHLKPLPVTQKPWESNSMHFITGLSNSNRFMAILLVVDRLTRMVHFIARREDIKAKDLANLI